MTPAQRRLAARLGHSFTDAGLLVRALTHRSAGARNNERLEFLGDSILTFLVAEHLYNTRPDAPEGKLTRLRSRVVRRESLASAARKLGVVMLWCSAPASGRPEATGANPFSPVPSRRSSGPCISIRTS